jgi:hypothetical protein
MWFEEIPPFVWFEEIPPFVTPARFATAVSEPLPPTRD